MSSLYILSTWRSDHILQTYSRGDIDRACEKPLSDGKELFVGWGGIEGKED